MTEAEHIHEANMAGLAAFKKLNHAEQRKRLVAMGLIDGKGNLTAEYGGARPAKKARKSTRA